MNLLTPVAVRVGGIRWLPRYLRQITAIDKLLQRMTRGRWSLLKLAGLPDLMLVVPGRRTQLVRSTPLLCVPLDGSWLVAGSNFGHPRAPAWVANLRAARDPLIRCDGRTLPVEVRELTGADRDRAWVHMLRTWPNYAKYAARTERVIPIFELTPRR